MKVFFWSNVHGQTGVTSNLIATSLYSAIQNKKKNAVMQSDFLINNLSKSILGTNFEDTFLDVGIDALFRDIKTGPLLQETAEADSITMLNGLYSIFPETSKKNKGPYEAEVYSFFNPIVNGINPYYDTVYIDVASGYSDTSMQILDNADIVVVCLNQNKNVIEQYIDRPLSHNNVIYLFGNYDRKSKFNIKNLRRTYPILKNGSCVSIEHSSNYLDALNEGKVIEYFYRNYATNNLSENYAFMQSVKGVVNAIAKKGEELVENA